MVSEIKYSYWILDRKRIPKNIEIHITNCINNWLTLYADHKNLFDKLSKCPVVLPLPTNRKEENFLYDSLKWLTTRKGKITSNSYDFDKWIKAYPEDLRKDNG